MANVRAERLLKIPAELAPSCAAASAPHHRYERPAKHHAVPQDEGSRSRTNSGSDLSPSQRRTLSSAIVGP